MVFGFSRRSLLFTKHDRLISPAHMMLAPCMPLLSINAAPKSWIFPSIGLCTSSIPNVMRESLWLIRQSNGYLRYSLLSWTFTTTLCNADALNRASTFETLSQGFQTYLMKVLTWFFTLKSLSLPQSTKSRQDARAGCPGDHTNLSELRHDSSESGGGCSSVMREKKVSISNARFNLQTGVTIKQI